MHHGASMDERRVAIRGRAAARTTRHGLCPPQARGERKAGQVGPGRTVALPGPSAQFGFAFSLFLSIFCFSY